MSSAELAGLIVAGTGAIAALFAGLRNLRGDRFNRDVSSSAALLTGYKDMVENLGKELDGERQQRSQERRELYEELDKERQRWARERRELHDEIDELRERIDKLMRRSPQERTRRDDNLEGAS